MKSALTSLGVMLALIAGICWLVDRQTPARQLEQKTGLTVGQPVTYRNLTIFPVVSVLPRDNDRFITLDEGLRAGTVEIREVGGAAGAPNQTSARQSLIEDPFGESADADSHDDSEESPDQGAAEDPFVGDPSDQTAADLVDQDFTGNEVNRLLVINRSDKPLYLMPGEILLGGDQDRTIGQELVIAPSQGPVPVEVFCVEHGRWGRRDRDELAGYIQNMAVGGVPAGLSLVISQTQDIHPDSWTDVAAAEAESGKFIASIGSLSKSARLAVQQDKEQSRVWDEVAVGNSLADVQPRSGAFTANYAEADAVQRLQPYMAGLAQPIESTQHVVGVIVAIHGKVESLDVFESTPLFRKLWPKLLKSYALDAANAAGQADYRPPQSCSRADAIAFFNKASQSKEQKHESLRGITVASSDTDDLVLFTAHEAAQTTQPSVTQVIPVIDGSSQPSMGGMGMGGMMGAVHTSGYAK